MRHDELRIRLCHIRRDSRIVYEMTVDMGWSIDLLHRTSKAFRLWWSNVVAIVNLQKGCVFIQAYARFRLVPVSASDNVRVDTCRLILHDSAHSMFGEG
jgi:hypothetical protein